MNDTKYTHPDRFSNKDLDLKGTGARALWNGPYDNSLSPKGKGRSSGITGIKLRFDEVKEPTGAPITQIAKARV